MDDRHKRHSVAPDTGRGWPCSLVSTAVPGIGWPGVVTYWSVPPRWACHEGTAERGQFFYHLVRYGFPWTYKPSCADDTGKERDAEKIHYHQQIACSQTVCFILRDRLARIWKLKPWGIRWQTKTSMDRLTNKGCFLVLWKPLLVSYCFVFGFCSLCVQSFVCRHLLIAPILNVKTPLKMILKKPGC